MAALADIGALENHLQKKFTTPDSQAAANQALILASGAVRAYCGWDLDVQDETFEDYGDGSCVLTLPTLSLLDVRGISVNGTDLPLPDPNIVWTLKGQILNSNGWAKECVVTVDATHGYNPLPDLIRLVVLDVAGKQMNNPEGLVSATVGEVSRTYSSSSTAGMTALHQTLLDRYRVI